MGALKPSWMLVGLVLSFVPCVFGQTCPTRPDVGSKPRRYAGFYENRAYGFSVVIPNGSTGFDADDPMYQRGFTIALPRDGGFLTVLAEANSAEYTNARASARELLLYLRDRTQGVFRSTLSEDLVDHHSAEQVSADFSCAGDRRLYTFLALTTMDENRRFVYTIMWEGPASSATAARDLIHEIRNSWTFIRPR